MAYAVVTDALHDRLIRPPVLSPLAHVMVGWVVDTARPAFTLRLWVCVDRHVPYEAGLHVWCVLDAQHLFYGAVDLRAYALAL